MKPSESDGFFILALSEIHPFMGKEYYCGNTFNLQKPVVIYLAFKNGYFQEELSFIYFHPKGTIQTLQVLGSILKIKF